MHIKEAKANIILDSRGEETIEITITSSKNCAGKTSAPSGKSKGKHEKQAYKDNDIKKDVNLINKLKTGKLPEVKEFEGLIEVEKKLRNRVGANTLFCFEASVLKALASERKIQLWQLLNPNASVFPRIISNTIGGGVHSDKQAKIHPDFQEFLVTCNKNPSICKFLNKKCHDEAGIILQNFTANPLKQNDENAWITDEDNERVLEIMKEIQETMFEESGIHADIGLDAAGSQLFKNGKYHYKNRKSEKTRGEQIGYMLRLADKYNLFYIEDPLEEDDFSGFSEMAKQADCLIVGDDLTATNLERTEKAIQMEAITGIIIKPNQTGSLLEAKKVIDLCKKAGIRTIMSHRSGETLDTTISDLSFAWQCDFIKVPVAGKEREAKVNRLIDIENSLKKPAGFEAEVMRRHGIVRGED